MNATSDPASTSRSTRTSARWLEAEDLLRVLGEVVGVEARVRDGGILHAAVARPAATLAGAIIYRTALDQAAALLHGIIRWRPLDVWNAKLGWAAAAIHLERDGYRLTMPPKELMRLTDELTSGAVDTVREISNRLAPFID